MNFCSRQQKPQVCICKIMERIFLPAVTIKQHRPRLLLHNEILINDIKIFFSKQIYGFFLSQYVTIDSNKIISKYQNKSGNIWRFYLMKTLSYKIEAPNGLHARPCVSIIALARNSGCSIVLSCRGIEAAAENPIDLMALGAGCGDKISVTVEGPNEESVGEQLLNILETEL